MEKFNRTAHGYDPEQVNAFLDQVINQVEKIVGELKVRDERILELEEELASQGNLREKLHHYQRMEETLNKALFMAQKTSDQIKSNAYRESEVIIDNAKKNASRIVNEALMEAEKAEVEASRIRRNVVVYKRKLKDLLQAQLSMIEDIEKVNF